MMMVSVSSFRVVFFLWCVLSCLLVVAAAASHHRFGSDRFLRLYESVRPSPLIRLAVPLEATNPETDNKTPTLMLYAY